MELALLELGVGRDEVEVDVLNRGRSGILGIGAEPAQVRVSLITTDSANARPGLGIVNDLLDLLDADANPGERLAIELPHSGGYDVLCDMHPGMTAFLFASDAAHTALAETDGTFVLEDVAPGTYNLRLWTADDGMYETRRIEVGTGHTGIDLGLPG